jgi:hypothetical protein
MKELFKNTLARYTLIILIIIGFGILGYECKRRSNTDQNRSETDKSVSDFSTIESIEASRKGYNIKNGAEQMPVYGNWKTFTQKDGLPSDHAYTVRIDGDRVLVGTHDGLAVYENGKWRT